MAIAIKANVYLFFFIIIINWILSLGKNKLMRIAFVILSSIFSFVGIIGIIIIRPRFVHILNRNAAKWEFESSFVVWAIDMFDSYAMVSIIITCIAMILLLLYLFLTQKKSNATWQYVTGIIALLMAGNFIAGIIYGIQTINKLFDISSYISLLSLAEYFALHIPIVVKRILLKKKLTILNENKQQ